MSYDYEVNGHIAKITLLSPVLFLPLQIYFKTTESGWPTLCGDGGHRIYHGRYCLTEPYKGYIQVDLVGEVGFLEKETLFGWLDKSDGHFKINVPRGGLPLEPCAVTISNFLTGRKYGVRFTGDPQKLGIAGPVLDSCGVAFFDDATQTFAWVGIDDAGSFKDGGQYGSQLWGVSFGARGGPQVQYDPTMLYTTKSVLGSGDTPVWTHYTETWTPSGITLSHNVEHETDTKVLLGWQNTDYADPPVPDYTKPEEYVVTGILTPWFNAAGYSWRRVSWKQGVQQLTYIGYQCSNGRVYGAFLQNPSLPAHSSSSTLIQGYGYRPVSDPLSNQMEQYVAWEVRPSDIHSGCDVLTVAAQCKEYFVVHATDSATYDLDIYAIVSKANGGIAWVHNWAEYPHLSSPAGSACILSGIAWLFCRDIVNDKAAAFNMQSGQLHQYYYWRDVYRWPAPPGPPARNGNQVPQSDGQLGWGFHTTTPYTMYETVYRGEVCLIGSLEDFYVCVAEGGPTDDLSNDCSEGYYKAKARFTIKSLPSNSSVGGATVTVKIMAGPAGEAAVFEEEVTGVTDSGGQVWFQPSACVERTTSGEFVFTFIVLTVAKERMLYSPGNNQDTEAEHVYEALM